MLFRSTGKLYGGIGLNLDLHNKIDDELLSLDSATIFYTSHYLYSDTTNFDFKHYNTNGLSFNVLYDSRDNSINPYKDYYASFGVRQNFDLGSNSQSSTMLNAEFRTYISLSEVRPEHLIAFWLLGSYNISGTAPYLALPSIGWDTYNRSGRGYIQGRFRGDDLQYQEIEYRFPVSKNGLFSGVVFLNATTSNNRYIDQKLFEKFAFGYGAGLRLKMNKATRTNLCVDFGRGNMGGNAFYFGLQEAF